MRPVDPKSGQQQSSERQQESECAKRDSLRSPAASVTVHA